MHSDRDRIGAPERLDVPFELKALTTLRTDDGAEVGVFEGLAATFGAPDLAGDKAAATHAVGERVVVLADSRLLRVTLPDTDLNAARLYRAVTVGGRPDEGSAKALTLVGQSLMPYAPVDVRGARAGSPADWTITWIRRTRLGGAWKDAVDVLLGEESEAYEVDILNGAAVVRTITGTASAGGSVVVPGSRQATYGAAEQIADFGAEQATVTVRVYQIGSLVGRGFAAAASFSI